MPTVTYVNPEVVVSDVATPASFVVMLGNVLRMRLTISEVGDAILDRLEAGEMSQVDALAWADRLEREAFVIRTHVAALNQPAKDE